MNSKNKKANTLIKPLNSNVKVVDMLSDNKVVKGFLLYLKTKKKIVVANKMFSSGRISLNNYTDYIKKVRREAELSKKNIMFLDEVLFETNDCTLSSVFENGSISYCINQYGMKEYYDDLTTALEHFVRISI